MKEDLGDVIWQVIDKIPALVKRKVFYAYKWEWEAKKVPKKDLLRSDSIRTLTKAPE